MEKENVVAALAALAQDNRLDVFRLLVQTGAGGLPAGGIAERLGIASPTLSFHLAQLRHAGLVQMRRDGKRVHSDAPHLHQRQASPHRDVRDGAREIYRIYLTNDLPYDGALAKEASNIGNAIERLIERILEVQFARREENKFLEVTLRSGRKDVLYRSDLLSGAIIASIVERAKGMAIKRAIADQGSGDSMQSLAGISESDLQLSFLAEFTENDIFPPADMTEDWLKLIDYDPENVVKIAPVRRDEKTQSRGGVI